MKTEITDQINKLPKKSIIVISGFGGSGKSTLAKSIGKELLIPVISIDDFYREMEDYHYWSCYDYDRFLSDVINPFKKNLIQKYKAYNWQDPSIPLTKILLQSNYLIIEGVGLFNPKILNKTSFSIWVDCPIEEASIRGKSRDKHIYGVSSDTLWNGIWKTNDLECFKRFSPFQKADFIYPCKR